LVNFSPVLNARRVRKVSKKASFRCLVSKKYSLLNAWIFLAIVLPAKIVDLPVFNIIDENQVFLLSFIDYIMKYLLFFIKFGNVPLIYTRAFYKIKANRNQKKAPHPLAATKE
jgi:hypothetical protein